MSGIWSSELASRLPGTPVRLQSGVGAISPVKEIIHDQPRSGGTASVTKKRNKTTSPLCSEMDQHLTELDLLLELKMLSEDPVPGVFLLPSTKSLLEWHGILFLHNGPWKGGIFRFTLYIPDEFPQMRPMIRFKSNVYHPYIHTHNGAMNMLQVLPNWKSKTHHIKDVILAMRGCFFRDEFLSASSKEEGIAIKEKIRSCVEDSNKQSQHNGDPENVFNFTDNETMITKARQLLHEGGLPEEDKGNSTGILDTLSATVSQLFDFVIGQ